jgi:hypothetical protein
MKIEKLQLFKTYLFLVSLIVCVSAKAQFLPNSNAPYNSPTYLINSVLLGNGVTATNIQYQGKPMQIGYFTGGVTGNVNIGIDSGIVIPKRQIIFRQTQIFCKSFKQTMLEAMQMMLLLLNLILHHLVIL